MILNKDFYEMFNNTALILDNPISGEYAILSVNICSLPDNLVAINSPKYPWLLSFLQENNFAEYDGSKVVSDNTFYPVVKLTNILDEPVDVSNIIGNYMKGALE